MNVRLVKVLMFSVLIFSACSNNGSNQEQINGSSGSTTPKYFDLDQFFKEEIARLETSETLVRKTVVSEDKPEEKVLEIKDWNREFALFIQSDINKSAWAGSYRVDSSQHKILYTSIDPALRTKQIRIEKDISGRVIAIGIENGQSNMLYQTSENLYYYPDSLYHIERSQRIRIVGENLYKITGIFLDTP